MCVEKIHRVLMAIVLSISLYCWTIGSVFGLVIQGFVIVMLLVWAITGFCPAVMILSKFINKCESKCDTDKK